METIRAEAKAPAPIIETTHKDSNNCLYSNILTTAFALSYTFLCTVLSFGFWVLIDYLYKSIAL